MKHRKLYLSFVNPKDWRTSKEQATLLAEEWREIRKKVMEKGDYTCEYCGFKHIKWQIAHHLNHNKKDNDFKNLVIMCQMCNAIHHAGLGCVVWKAVELFKKSNYSQNEIIRITREMRQSGKTDKEIIKYLGLRKKAEFRMERAYLKNLFGFVTDRFDDKQKATSLTSEVKMEESP